MIWPTRSTVLRLRNPTLHSGLRHHIRGKPDSSSTPGSWLEKRKKTLTSTIPCKSPLIKTSYMATPWSFYFHSDTSKHFRKERQVYSLVFWVYKWSFTLTVLGIFPQCECNALPNGMGKSLIIFTSCILKLKVSAASGLIFYLFHIH